jgi:hypothetical protein
MLHDLTAKVLMADANPYASPKTQSASTDDSPSPPPRRSRFAYYVVPALIGAVVGGILLAPFCRGPGDPGGHSIGAGLGGLAALLVGFVLRIAASSGGRS